MKNILIIALTFLSLTYCTTDKKEKELSKKETVKVDVVTKESNGGDFSNPSFFMGSGNFISFMQGCSVRGDYDLMVTFTHSKSIEKYGLEKVKSFYEKESFNYKIKLKSLKEKNGEYTMYFETNKFATKGVAKFNVAIENDTCKLVLPEHLSDFGK